MFQNYRAYWVFSNRVKTSDRFALNSESQDFLEKFRRGIHERVEILKKRKRLFRAVRDYTEDLDEENRQVHITGASEDRILPKRQFAFEGRVNPSGIVVLYLASSMETAVSEVRPWIGETISIAQFSISRDLKIVNLAKGHDKHSLLQLTMEEMADPSKISNEKSNKCTWIDIDSAFSRPTTRTDTGAEYTPTQILSEAVKNEGFDGIFYKSSFGGEQGYNIALFNLEDADVKSCNAFSIDGISIDFNQAGNAWSKK